MNDRRIPVRRDRVRTIPKSFSWIDREVLHNRLLHALTLDPYKDDIKKILQDHEAAKKKFPALKELTTKHILKEIRKRGYTGGHTILDDYLRTIRGPRRRVRRPYCRFETTPAQESQQDWSTYWVEMDGKKTRIQLFSMVLCWSRYQFLYAFSDQKLESLLYGHVAAFKYFGGVPWQVVYDRQAAITPCEVAGKPLKFFPSKAMGMASKTKK